MTRICSTSSLRHALVISLLTLLVVLSPASFAQNRNSVSSNSIISKRLITQAVDPSKLTLLNGNTHPFARPEFDQGPAPATLPMQRMLLVLERSPGQESALRQLLDDQQNKNSSNYHKWLTPDEFGTRFGPSASDLHTVTSWLQSQGFQVTALSKGRTAIEFSGSAAQVQQAFHTAIHKYFVNGEAHWANASDPSIPSALATVVKGVVSLHNFPRHSYSTIVGTPPATKARQNAPLPLFTFTPQQTTYYGLGPVDFATIYNVLPLWNAGIDGTAQTIAIVGETNIHLSDIEAFRSLFGLPANDPTIIVNGEDPGVDGDETEALLDVSWSGAVAKNATIDFVVSASTESTLGVDLSALYIVDNNLAPVMSESYGICEQTLGTTGNAFYNALWQQAAAQGITVVVAAGDGGSAGCDNFDADYAASDGLAVSGFASTPYNVAVGGTDFDQTPATAPNYWSATNDPTTGASAKSYIPETTWNDSCAGFDSSQCTYDSNYLNIIAGSGGPSSQATSDYSGYSKPSWQTGPGVPADGVRDLPDVSLFASNGFNNSFYILCEADAGFFGSQETCSLTNFTFVGVGGTSASAPTFAGIMALVNQKMAAQGLSSRQGNANYVLYQLAAQNGTSCNSSTVALTGNSCIFYDITKGNNSVPCNPNTPNCGPASAGANFGVLVDPNNPSNPAWATTPGYDMATGLGSVNAQNLVNQWNSITLSPTVTTLDRVSPVSLTHGQSVYVHATVSPQSGSGTPTGSVALMVAPSGNEAGIGSLPLNSGVAEGNTSLLPGGTYNVTAHYPGDSTYAPSDSAPIQVTVAKENSQTKATLEAWNPVSRTFSQTSTIQYGTVFFLRSGVTNSAGTSCIPNPTLTQVSCPTGTVSFTNNGKTLDNGTYTLNTQGYTEDQTLTPEFSTAGSYALGAQYSGDNSFNSSSTTLNVTVTQAPTMMDCIYVDSECGVTNPTMYSGQSFSLAASAFAYSVLSAPTGTITFLQNGAAPSGTVQLTSLNGSYTGNYSTAQFNFAYLAAQLNTVINTPGTYTITASYPGDANYTGSQNQIPLTITVVDTTFNISTPIPNVTISAPGQSGTASVSLVSTDNFFGPVTVTCTLPAAMTESTCPSTTATLNGGNVNAQLTITTTAPHQITASNRHRSVGLYGFGIFAGVFLLTIPGRKRYRLPLSVLLSCGIALIVSCGGNSSPPPMDPGTPPGTYTVNVTATSSGITRTGTFSVTVQ
jgi:Pro-kumamolisin, activation domain/Bacterial Ig-like domain (group 3)